MSAAFESSTAMEGRQLGEFILLDQIGAGGQGAVYRAKQSVLGREAAVKVVLTAGKQHATVMRFLREIKIAAQLDHPFAAHIYAFGVEPDLVWVAMEYVHGTPLDKLLKAEGKIPLRRFLPLLDRLCEVVYSAHEQGIIHRDIKPANVMVLSRAGRLLPKLLDLGIAKSVSVPENEDDPLAEPSLGPPVAGPSLPIPALTEDSTREVSRPVPLPDDSWATGEAVLASSQVSSRTSQSMVLGSPPYMAPEAWLSSSTVGKAVDIYSLGILAYECLSGRRPFNAKSEYALTQLHLNAEPPPLGDRFPPAFDDALRGALAKKPENRYATPIELSAALRAAAAQVDGGLPRLDAELRASWLASAPQPWAESVAQLHAARSEEDSWDSLSRLQRALVQYLAVLSIAAFTKVEHADDDGAVRDALAPLSTGTLSIAGWVAVTRAASRPFMATPANAPLPELVRAVWTAEGAETPLLAELVGMLSPATAGESDSLPAALEVTERVLHRLGFVGTYALGVRKGEAIESLVGLRRTPREALSTSCANTVDEGDVLVLDSEGRLHLRLTPLVTVTAAAASLPDEIFLLDGPARRGMKQIAFPGLFERQEEHARTWLEKSGLLVGGADLEAEEAAAPFLGLSTFRTEDAGLFFGREREIDGFVNRLRVSRLLTVVGPSGAGKSSFLQAGILPALPKDTITIVVRPGRNPLLTLAARLEREGIGGLTADAMKKDTKLLAQRVGLKMQASVRRRIFIVDQLEELFTLCLDVEEREAYAASLVALSEAGDMVRVLFTLRDDFLVRAEELTSLRARLGAGLQLLTTPQRPDLLRILLEPLRARGYAFEDETLPDEMVDSVQAYPGALALLSFTASQLWETRDKHFRRLTRRAYTQLGGVGGALAQHAEATLTRLNAAEQARAREAFRHLVTSQGTRATLTRVELQQLLGDDAAARSMLENLVAARLLVTQEGETGGDRVEIIHEALLSAWPRLVRWQREDAEAARLRDGLRAAARQWDTRARPAGLLWRDDALTEYRLWRARYRGALTDTEEAFAAASLRDAARGRHVRLALLAIAVVASLTFSASLWRANRVARAANAQAKQALRDSYFEQGRQFSLRGDSLRALVYYAEAQQLGAHGAAFDYVVTEAALPVLAQERSFGGAADGQLFDAQLSPNGKMLATASSGQDARLYDVETGTSLWRHHLDDRVTGSFFLDDNELVTISKKATRWRWRDDHEISSGPRIGTGYLYSRLADRVLYGSFGGKVASWAWGDNQSFVIDTGSSVEMCGYNADASRLFTSSWGRDGSLWDARSHARTTGLPKDPYRVAFAPGSDTRWAVLSGDDGALTVFDAAGKKIAGIPSTHKSGGTALSFSPDGTLIATGGADNAVRVWKSDTLEPVREMLGHSEVVMGLDFIGPRAFYTYSIDGTIRFWDTRSAVSTGLLAGHEAQVESVAFSQDRAHLVSGSYDGTARIWRWRDVQRSRVLPVEDLVDYEVDLSRASETEQPPLPSYGAMSPTGDRVGIFDGKRALWLAALDGDATCRVGDGTLAVREVAFTADGLHVLTAEQGQPSIGMWKASDCTLERRLEGHEAAVRTVRVSRDGRYVVSGDAAGTTRLWDARSGASLHVFAGTGMVARVAVSDDGELVLASYSSRKSIPGRQLLSAWRVKDGQLAWSIAAAPKDALFSFFHVLPTGHIVLTDYYGVVQLLDGKTGNVLRKLELPRDAFQDLVASPDGRFLVAVLRSKNALLLEAETLVERGEIDSASTHGVAFNRDGDLLFMSSAGNVRLFDVATRRLIATQVDADWVLPDPRHDRVVLLPFRGAPRVLEIGADSHASADLREIARCRVPYTLKDGQAVATPLPTDCSSRR